MENVIKNRLEKLEQEINNVRLHILGNPPQLGDGASVKELLGILNRQAKITDDFIIETHSKSIPSYEWTQLLQPSGTEGVNWPTEALEGIPGYKPTRGQVQNLGEYLDRHSFTNTLDATASKDPDSGKVSFPGIRTM